LTGFVPRVHVHAWKWEDNEENLEGSLKPIISMLLVVERHEIGKQFSKYSDIFDLS